jgi:UDP-2-acetamido-3-amino-2,3-dideoxy-glucuronate N-acetyltransferase
VSPQIHASALCEAREVGEGTRIWAFVHVLPGARIGRECNLCDHVFIENDVQIGDRVTIKSGVQVWDGITLGDDVFVGPNATFTNDRFPRSRKHGGEYPRTVVGNGASIGGGATILPGIQIGQGAMVGAGAVVTKNVPPHAVVVGNPARITGYANSSDEPPRPTRDTPPDRTEIRVRGVRMVPLTQARDLRGRLVAVDFSTDLPFVPCRTFTVFDVPTRQIRGEHAHRQCEQILIVLLGEMSLMVDDGVRHQVFRMADPGVGVYVPAGVWASQFNYTEDALLLVLASRKYEPEDYIRDYDEFLATVGSEQGNQG